MNKHALLLPAVAVTLATLANAQAAAPPTKVGVIHIQNAIAGTNEGKKAAADLESRVVAPKRKDIEAKQTDLGKLQDQLKRGSNTMAADAREKLIREIDQKTKALQRDTEDAQAEVEQEQNKVLQELGQRMMAVIDKYARDNNYTLILDVSSPQTPVLYISSGIDITQEIVALYDKNAPAQPASTVPKPLPPPPPKKK